MEEAGARTVEIGKALAERPAYFENVAIDNLFSISLELGAALWVVTDRVRTLEGILKETGLLTEEMIESHKPSREQTREARDEFINQIYGVIKYSPDRRQP
jgi:hypothetical protein